MEAVPGVATDSNCRKLGGISVGGWITLMTIVGMAVGALLGAMGTLWYVGRLERQRRRELAMGTSKMEDGQLAGGSLPSHRGAPSSARDAANAYAPMGTAMYKQQRPSSAELSSFGTMQFVSGVGGGNPQPLQTPPHSRFPTPRRRQPLRPRLLSGGGQQACGPPLLPGSRQQSQELGPSGSELHDRNWSSTHGGVEEAVTTPVVDEPVQVPLRPARTEATHGSEAQGQGPNGQKAAGHIRALSAQLSPKGAAGDCADLDESVHVKLAKQYELHELEPEWHGILAIVDKKLVEQNQRCQRADERPIVMRSLLKSSPRRGAEAAISDAVSCLLKHRIGLASGDKRPDGGGARAAADRDAMDNSQTRLSS
ncbi:unnamed protein product [Ostreobium quekettii]|uniref:Uncharacterized protein n=1 Tax=Ostreobium quekettii TaxID=121088 RepID=A0A8S1J4H7_9CHLO|nr:unnamed protein product [Ostreobium quekettii]